MSEGNPQQELQVSNPFQAMTEIFYSPKGVFDALAVKNNWSWIPFFLIIGLLFLPPYLYFGIVNFDWYLELAIMPSLEELAPSQQEAALANYTPSLMSWTTGPVLMLGSIIWFAIMAFYFSLVTKNDDKSVQGFTDWYGAMWWISMPIIVGALISLVLLSFQDAGSEVSASILSPLSLGYLLGTEMSSPWFNFLNSIRLEAFWSIFLAAICIQSWTHFTFVKAIIISAIPSVIVWLISLGFVF